MIKGKAKMEFGKGSILMTPCYRKDGIGALCCITQNPRKIGEMVENTCNWNPKNADVILTFDKTESIDILIEELQEVRKYMMGEIPDEGIDIKNELDFDSFLEV